MTIVIIVNGSKKTGPPSGQRVQCMFGKRPISIQKITDGFAVDLCKMSKLYRVDSPFPRFRFGDKRLRFTKTLGDSLLSEFGLLSCCFKALEKLSVFGRKGRSHARHSTIPIMNIPKWDII